MKKSQEAQSVEMIPIERITVINPRVRNKKIFKEITMQIPVHRGQSFRRIADSVPVIADSFR
jgi:hypothetical protein